MIWMGNTTMLGVKFADDNSLSFRAEKEHCDKLWHDYYNAQYNINNDFSNAPCCHQTQYITKPKVIIKEVVKEVPVEKVVVKDVVKEVPVIKEVVKEVPVIKEVVKEVPVIKEVVKEVEKIIEKTVIQNVSVFVPVPTNTTNNTTYNFDNINISIDKVGSIPIDRMTDDKVSLSIEAAKMTNKIDKIAAPEITTGEVKISNKTNITNNNELKLGQIADTVKYDSQLLATVAMTEIIQGNDVNSLKDLNKHIKN